MVVWSVRRKPGFVLWGEGGQEGERGSMLLLIVFCAVSENSIEGLLAVIV